MADPSPVALRFQRTEIEAKADLSPSSRAILAEARGPQELMTALAAGDPRDAVFTLAFLLPHRQLVWWTCLAVRLLPDLAHRPTELAAVEAAEAWVQNAAASAAEHAGGVAERSDLQMAAGWTAMAAYWSGPSLAPRGQTAVPPAPHLPAIAARTALLLLTYDPAVSGRLGFADQLIIGLAVMQGDLGRQAQAAVRDRLRLA